MLREEWDLGMKEQLNTIAFVGNYLPRQCGIATFTTDLRNAVATHATGRSMVLAMNDREEGYDYPSEVWLELSDEDRSDYITAAEMLNMRQVDLVCLQHEYGIFGGEAGRHITAMLRRLNMPVVPTLHTVLQDPSPQQQIVMEEIADLSDRLVVMSERAVEFLTDIYGLPRESISFIHHGIPDLPFADSDYWKPALGAGGRRLLLTFGLLSPAKGIEHMIDALPSVVERHPDVLYMVLGATHPALKRECGEEYRESLIARSEQLGVADHVAFVDRFIEIDELCDYLCAADAYVTPYINEAQITSGTLAYALGAGKPVVSTPYWYAEEMLADGRGVLVPFNDSEALGEAVGEVFSDDATRNEMRRYAYDFTRQMVWSRVGQEYLELFSEVRSGRRTSPRLIGEDRAARWLTPPPAVNLGHIRTLTDGTGILQHGCFGVGDRGHGYCTDDVARALITVVEAEEAGVEDDDLRDLQTTYVSFLHHAFNPLSRRFRNFMSYDRRWLDEEGAEDAHGRAVQALGIMARFSDDQQMVGLASNLLDQTLPLVLDFSSPRAWAGGLIAANNYLERFRSDRMVNRAQAELAQRLLQRYADASSHDWPWFEDYLTYDNARFTEALLGAGDRLGRTDMIDCATEALAWLFDHQITNEGHLAPVGCHGWSNRGEEPSLFDQQPLEASSLARAAAAAFRVTGDRSWEERVLLCWEWFEGRNSLGVSLYDRETGACYDGLRLDGVNRNQGAESTIAAVMTLIVRQQVARVAQPRLGLVRRTISASAADGSAT